MKPTVIGLTSWPNTREGVLTRRREPAPTAFAAPASILRREMESNIAISLSRPQKTAGARGVTTFDRTRQAASMVQIGVDDPAVACVGTAPASAGGQPCRKKGSSNDTRSTA